MTDNRAAFEHFCDLFYTQKRSSEAFDYLVSPVGYRQHNPHIADGADAAKAALRPKFEGNPNVRFEVLRTIVEGDLAMVHVRAHNDGAADAAIADIYRFEGGKLVEHWDVLQAMPDNPAHDHPMF